MSNHYYSSSLLLLSIITALLLLLLQSSSSSIFISSQQQQISEKEILLQSKAQLVGSCTSSCLPTWTPENDLENFEGISLVNGRINTLALLRKNLQGTLPDAFSQLTELTALEFNENPGLTGALPSSWSSLKNLDAIEISRNSISGELPSSWSSMVNLTIMELSFNKIDSVLPPSWKSMTKMRAFLVRGQNIRGPLPNEFSAWGEHLNNFLADNNQIGGVFPSSYSAFTKIILFQISGNALTQNIPESYSSWNQTIDIFDVSNNFLSGELPSKSLSSWTEISVFSISDNNFHSTISSDLTKNWKNLELFDISSNNFFGELPEFSLGDDGNQVANIIIDLRSNKFNSTSLPESYSNISRLNQLDLSNNLIKAKSVPKSYCKLANLAALDLSQNCIDIDDETLECLSKIPTLTKIDLTPKCFDVFPFATTAPMSTAFSYSVQNFWRNDSKKCTDWINTNNLRSHCSDYPQFSFVDEIQNNKVFQFQLTCSGNNILPLPNSCVVLLYRPVLECFLDEKATIPCSTLSQVFKRNNDNNNNNNDNNNQKKNIIAEPSYQNKTVLGDLSTGSLLFDASTGVEYLHGCFFRVRLETALKFAAEYTGKAGLPGPRTINQNATSSIFKADPCQQEGSVAIEYSTSCTVCPELARCDGTTSIFVSDQKPSWRYSSKVLPFYECDARTTKGCLKSGSDSSNNNTKKFDGSSCREHFTGFLCARCEANFAMVNNECTKCPVTSRMIGIFCACIISLLVIATLLVYVSLDSVVKKNRDEEENNEEDEETSSSSFCEEEHCSELRTRFSKIKSSIDASLHRYRPQLEKLAVIVRMLINHFTLLGALASTSAAKHATDSLRGFLEVQNSGGGGALLGAYSGTLSCLFSNDNRTSSSVLNFNILWIVFASVFAFESIFFFLFTRKLTSSAAVALFLSFVAFSPLAQASSKLLALCHDYYFYETRDYLLYGGRKDFRKFSFSFLSTDLAQECNDNFMSTSRVGAALTISLFCGLLPVIIAFAYKKIQSEDDRTAIFTFFTKNYKKRAWYYELVVMVRKLLIALVVSIFVDRGDLQLQLYTLVATMMLIASLSIQPLQSKLANIVDQVSISSAIVCATFLSVIASFSENEGVAITSTIFIFLTQILAILAIIFTGHRQQASSSSSMFASSYMENDNNDSNNVKSHVSLLETSSSYYSPQSEFEYGTADQRVRSSGVEQTQLLLKKEITFLKEELEKLKSENEELKQKTSAES